MRLALCKKQPDAINQVAWKAEELPPPPIRHLSNEPEEEVKDLVQ